MNAIKFIRRYLNLKKACVSISLVTFFTKTTELSSDVLLLNITRQLRVWKYLP